MSPRLRFQILSRDNFTCRYCGRKAPTVELHVDHVLPQALGGMDIESNLVSACSDCNLGKQTRLIEPPPVALSHNNLWAFHEEELLRQKWGEEFPAEQKPLWKGRDVREFLFCMGPDQLWFEVRHALGIANSFAHGSAQAWSLFRSRCLEAIRLRKEAEERATDHGYWVAWQSHSLVRKTT